MREYPEIVQKFSGNTSTSTDTNISLYYMLLSIRYHSISAVQIFLISEMMVASSKTKKKQNRPKRLAGSPSTPSLNHKSQRNGTDGRSDSPRLDPNSCSNTEGESLDSEVESPKRESEAAPPEVEPVAKPMSPAEPKETKQLGKHGSSPNNKPVALRSSTPLLMPGSPRVRRNPPSNTEVESPKREQSEVEPVAKPAQPVSMSVEGSLSGESVVGRRALMFHLAALRQRRGS